MLTLLATTTLLCGIADGTGQKDAAAELAGLADQFAKVESYKFTSKSETEGGGFGGGARGGDRGGARGDRGGEGAGQGGGQGGRAGGDERRGGAQGRAGQQPQVTEGLWMNGMPMQVTIGDAVAYKDGEQIVYADADGNWKVYEAPARGQGRGGQGRGGQGRGGQDRGGQGGGERGGQGGDDSAREAMRAMRAMRSVVGVTAPHEQFKGFAALVSDVEVSAAEAKPATDDLTGAPAKMIYTGKLTEAGTEAFGAAGGFGRRGGRGGAGGGGRGDFQMETSGTFTIEVVKGAITGAEFAITRSGTFGEREFERTTKRIYTFSDAGKVKLEVPEDALALFEI